MNFLHLPNAPLEQARVVILPVPYEGTVSWGHGASRGPAALLQASGSLEYYDEELRREPYRDGYHTLPPVGVELASPEAMGEAIRQAALPHVVAGRVLAAVGGEHGITPWLVDAVRQARGDDFGILQLDAHADMRHSYQGTIWSHGCVMRRLVEKGLPVTQVGIRSLSQEEALFLAETGGENRLFWAREIWEETRRGEDRWIARVIDQLPLKVYVTLDLDGLDPSVLPATGTPVAGGLGFYEVLRLLRRVGAEREVVGLDLVELAPLPGNEVSEQVASHLLYKMLAYFVRGGCEMLPTKSGCI
ncbi:MAG: agmatinase [Magnetococcales bacterium]|nr:agmatinase [Magnetococcales bacterium]